MQISIIAAMDKNGLIGNNNKLPWSKISEDLRHFKKLTLGKPVIMGRKTFDSIGGALPERQNIILTTHDSFSPKNCAIADSVEKALSIAGNVPEIMVIGGASIYKLFLPRADRLYLTIIDAIFCGDIFFPPIDFSQWTQTEILYSYSPTFLLTFKQFERK